MDLLLAIDSRFAPPLLKIRFAPMSAPLLPKNGWIFFLAIRRCSCLNVSSKFDLHLEGKYSPSLSARPHLYSRKCKRMDLVLTSANQNLSCRKFKSMASPLTLVRYDIVLVLTLVQNSICTSRGKYSFSLNARPHLYSRKCKRMDLV